MAISQAAQTIVAAVQANTALIATLATSDGAQAAADLAAISDAVAAQTAAFKAAGATGTPSSSGLTISPATLPAPVVAIPYSVQLTAAGGAGPYSFSLAPDSASLPPGLALTGAGEISGTPTTSGTYPVAIDVVDTTSPTALTGSESYTFTF